MKKIQMEGRKNMTQKIVVAGHICLDIAPAFLNDKGCEITDLFCPGGLSEVGSADIHIGGSVANTGLALKMLGAFVCLMSKIGHDHFGSIVKEQLNKFAEVDHIMEDPDGSTSYSVVLAPKGIDRMFLHHPGTNHTFSGSDLDYDEIKEAGLFHFGYPPLMKKIYQRDGEELLSIFQRVKSLGVATSLDMAAVDQRSEAAKADWEKIIKRVIPYVDFFLPSIEELAFMIDRQQYDSWKKRADGGDITSVLRLSEIEKLADRLLDWGANIVLMKCGAAGLYLAVGGEKRLKKTGIIKNVRQWADKRHFEYSYKPHGILSGTGAGDTSIAAFLQAVMSGYSWEDCLKLAAAMGASCVESYDAVSNLKSLEEQMQRIEKGWEKQYLLLPESD